MPSLFETQAAFRDAITGGNTARLLSGLTCPGDAAARLAIYRRHHRESFRRHLRARFPTVEWLIGTPQFLELADETVRRAPPRAPSLAEYGAELVDTLSALGGDPAPYLADAARLDWQLGRLSVAMARQPIGLAALSPIHPDALTDVRLMLQPGTAFLHLSWPVHEIQQLRQEGTEPETFTFHARETHLQLRGAAGRLWIEDIAPGPFAFRSCLAAGATLGEAAGRALSAAPDFDLTGNLASLFHENLVVGHSAGQIHA